MAYSPHKKEMDLLRAQYDMAAASAQRLISALCEQFAIMIDQEEITLAVPIEARVKSWKSLVEKMDRKEICPSNFEKVTDIAGMRIITLFQKDVEKLDSLIRNQLVVREAEDTAGRLHEAQFGYRSNHYIACIRDSWGKIPSFKALASMPVEIQVRTLSQHMWAAASHKLQYKREDSVPPRLRRSINRVSAILEMVDLEFSRILQERDEYENQESNNPSDYELNVDNLKILLSEVFPEENFDPLGGDYDNLLVQIRNSGILNTENLRSTLIAGRDSALISDKNHFASADPEFLTHPNDGVYFTHVGLAREALRATMGPLLEDPTPSNN